KISQVSKRVRGNGLSSASAPVYIIGDCYIAAGAAFANPGRNGVVCPPSWLAGALNYNAFVNGGDWGTMHEYNHCWQGYGLKNGGEVTNNATTLISYSLYTRISQNRTLTGGLSGWNRFTDPAKALGELLNLGANGSIREDLSVYATLLHNIGQDLFVTAATGGKDSGSTTYFNNLVNSTHYDMTYYFTDVLHLGVESGRGVTQEAVDAVKAKNYPMFVPVASVYQVGRSIIYDNEKQYIYTAQPFLYGSGEFTMDFNNKNGDGTYNNKNLVIPDGFTVSVVSVTQPANGSVQMLGNNCVKYIPKAGKDGLYSGNFRVKLRIIKDDNAFIVEDVDLVINLKQSTGSKLERTTYVYDTADAVPDTASIYNANTKTFNFGAYASTETKINVCTQETNTQIWAAGWNYDDDSYIEGSTNYRVMPVNQTLQTMEGSLYFAGAGTYRFTLKGRGKATLYLSYDNGDTWENALTIERSSDNKYVNTQYSEHTFTTAKNYVRFKVVLLVTKVSDFFGVGFAKQNANGTFPNFSNASAIPNSDVELHKVVNEEAAKKFETDYHFKTDYRYSYTGIVTVPVTENKLVSVSHGSWDNTVPIANLFDGQAGTYYHSEQNVYITEEKPFELVADLGSLHTVNSVTLNGYKNKVGNNGMAKSFKLYGSTDGNNYFLVTEVTDSPANAKNMTFNFDAVQIRYYKFVVTKTDNERYFAMNSIVFTNTAAYAKGHVVVPNDETIRYIGNWSYENPLSNFGIVYTAGAGDSVEYHFKGTRFAYFVYGMEELGTVDIYVDGKLIASDVNLSVKDPNVKVTEELFNQFGEKIAKSVSELAYIFNGDALANGEHVVKIVSKSGKICVDSFVYWD
ncbi:MAG: M60 family metallopeptidase, partial [Clostridia bacterium]|nr:M60 family metallopeptidase [Clostridia bacterium]